MRFSRKIIMIAAVLLTAVMAVFLLIPNPENDSDRPGQANLKTADDDAGNTARKQSPDKGTGDGGNRLLQLFARLTSLDRAHDTVEEDNPATRHRRLMERAVSEEKLPPEAVTPTGYGEKEREAHRRLLGEIIDLGERIRKGNASTAERKRHRDLTIRLLEEKIRHIRGFVDTMQDYGRGDDHKDDMERGAKTIERLEELAGSLKKEQ